MVYKKVRVWSQGGASQYGNLLSIPRGRDTNSEKWCLHNYFENEFVESRNVEVPEDEILWRTLYICLTNVGLSLPKFP